VIHLQHDHLDHISEGDIDKSTNRIPRISCDILSCEGKETGQRNDGDSVTSEDDGCLDISHVSRNPYRHEDEQSI
jgi:hypothetical protein